MLTDNNLPDAVAEGGGGKSKLPEGIWARICSIKESGGIDAVKQKLKNLGDQQSGAQHLIASCRAQLDKENFEDQAYRTRLGAAWTRPTSDSLTQRFKDQVNTYEAQMKQAVEANNQIA